MKNILITGSTDGIGKLAAIKLAKDGHKIYLHGRNSKKLEKVIREVKQVSSNDFVEGFVADFSDMSEVRKMANEVKSKMQVVDVLINNAGIFKTSNPVSADGYDVRFAVNYFAPKLLTDLLLPLLRKSEAGRIVNLSSAAQSPVDLKLLAKGELPGQLAYAQSKLALTMWSLSMAEKEKGITIIAVNPGSLLNTKMVKEAYGKHWSPAEKGGDILYDLAVSSEYMDESGRYFDNDRGDVKGMFSQAHPDAYQKDKIEALLTKTDDILLKLN